MSFNVVELVKYWLAGISVGQGITHADKKEWGYAEGQFRRALRLAPRRYDALYNLGEALAEQGKFQEAVEEFSKAIDVKPKIDTAWRLRGLIKIDLKDADGAIADCQKALEIERSFQNNLSLGMAFTEAKRFEEAVQALEAAAKMEPHNAAVNATWGDCLFEQGKLEEAKKAYQAAIKVNTKDGALFAKLAEVSEKLGDYKDALTYYTRASFLEPKNAEYRCAAAKVAVLDGDPSGAIISYQEAVKLDPECKDALTALCNHAMEMNDLEKAHSYAERMLSAYPRDWQANYQMSLVVAAEGDSQKAKEFMVKAKKIDKEAVVAAQEKAKQA